MSNIELVASRRVDNNDLAIVLFDYDTQLIATELMAVEAGMKSDAFLEEYNKVVTGMINRVFDHIRKDGR